MSGELFELPPRPEFTDEQMREIATRTHCPQVGDVPRLGDTVALGIEPFEPGGRIVAFRKREEDNGTPIRRGALRATVVREFRSGDGWFPTGECRMGAISIAWCAWEGANRYREPAQDAG